MNAVMRTTREQANRCSTLASVERSSAGANAEFGEDVEEHRLGERFAEHGDEIVARETIFQFALAASARDENGQRGVLTANLTRHFVAAAIGQAQIDDHRSQFASRFGKSFQCLLARSGLFHNEACVLQNIHREHANENFVLDDEHA